MSDERVGPCGEHCAVVDECDARGREITRLNAENEKLNVALEGYRDDARNFLVRLDDLNALRAENEKLRAALKPFAKAYPENEARMHEWTTGVTGVFLSDLRAAAAALKETGDE